ncbi:MAG: ABC transporter substrate-binding protein [Acidimicrobiales bacterium]
MRMVRRLTGGATALAAASLVLAACGGGTPGTTTTTAKAGGGASTTAAPGGSSTTAGGSSTTASAAGTPTKGGTLKLLGNSNVDHLDPVSAYYAPSYTLERAWTRQLFSYPASANLKKANSIAADVATTIPTKSNGGISADGKTYTIHIRQGVMWNTKPARQVTSKDFLREFKLMCNPASPVGAPGYYTATIVGMNSYCTAEGKIKATASAIAGFVKSNNISGITTPNSSTIVFHLTAPAGDFLNILALPFASAAPVEYLKYVPDSAPFTQHTLSDGPYYITSYSPGHHIDFARNPAWKASSDPLRKAYVNKITVTEGQTASAIQQQMQAGTADMAFDTIVPTPDIPALKGNPNFHIYPGGTIEYLVFNLQSPNNKGALSKLKVRQALEYAVNKTAIAQNYGGSNVAHPLTQMLTKLDLGYKPFALYKTSGSNGDPAKAKKLLAQAGYPNGLTLKLVYRTSGNHVKNAQSIQTDLKAAGVTVKLVPSTKANFYSQYLENPSNAKRGVWDVAVPGWIPDWYGNNGRSVIEPLFDGRHYGPNSVDYGDYNSKVTNGYIDQALAATSSSAAAKYWHKAGVQVMKDAAVIPLVNESTPLYHSSRVQNALYSPFAQNFDITNVWLKGA